MDDLKVVVKETMMAVRMELMTAAKMVVLMVVKLVVMKDSLMAFSSVGQ
jgi:hypothetical protein